MVVLGVFTASAVTSRLSACCEEPMREAVGTDLERHREADTAESTSPRRDVAGVIGDALWGPHRLPFDGVVSPLESTRSAAASTSYKEHSRSSETTARTGSTHTPYQCPTRPGRRAADA